MSTNNNTLSVGHEARSWRGSKALGRRISLVLLLAISTALTVVPTAGAGPSRYVFELCDSVLPNGGVRGVYLAQHPRFGFGAENTCEQPNGALILRQPYMPPGDGGEAAWAIPMEAPLGTVIESVRVSAASCAAPPSSGSVFVGSWPPPTCSEDTRDFPVDEDFEGFTISLGCIDYYAPDGSQCQGGPWVAAHFFAATIVDRESPELGEPTGTLLEPGIKRGRHSLEVAARDSGGGLAGISVAVNGLPAGQPKQLPCSVAQAKNRSVTGPVGVQPAPCPARASAGWTLDTGAFPFRHGPNSVEICAADFATLSDSNVSCTPPRTVDVDNSCFESSVGGGQVLSAQFAQSNAEQVTVRHGKAAKIIGRLANGAGDPIRGARLCVKSQTIGVDRNAAPVGSTLTDAEGRYSYEVPAGPNREIAIGYRHDTTQVAREVRYYARARSSLRVSTPRAKNGDRVRFWGKLPGPNGGGRVVVLQAGTVGSKRWITFRRATADPKGVFRAGYRFKSTTRKTRYRFRAVVPRQAGYPWVEGHSKPVQVLVTR
jgi:hypothetical protein